jgi:hypothetical protein
MRRFNYRSAVEAGVNASGTINAADTSVTSSGIPVSVPGNIL